MNELMPTMKMRFIEREIESSTDSQGRCLPEGIGRMITVRILQQHFVSDTSEVGEWRDVPLVAEI
jgi:hypothetical protein